ncbi:MAG: ABC transporter ATP-binding protein [Planctomycetota bacterium]|jgi:ABC-type lipoprotein export system ATPase subunit
MIEVTDLEFRYRGGEFRLRVPRLAVARGAAVALLGPSGSGKTTLLQLLAGIVVPDRGLVTVDGVATTDRPDAARRRHRVRGMGLVFQAFELLDYLSVLDNVLLPYRLSPALALDDAARGRAADLAARVGLADKLARPARRLSQGERQRVAVCRALVTEPRLLLADEPTASLDAANRDGVLALILDEARRTGATLVTATHDSALLDRFDDAVDLQARPDGGGP